MLVDDYYAKEATPTTWQRLDSAFEKALSLHGRLVHSVRILQNDGCEKTADAIQDIADEIAEILKVIKP
jgi:hypothetical protein